MKRSLLYILAAIAVISACKKSSSNCASDYSSCYMDNYQYTYPSGNIDTTEVTYWSANDSFSYTTHSGGINYIYTYKYKGDSISVRRYTNDFSTLSFYGTVHLNGQGFAASEIYYKQNGTLNSTGSSTYNADGTPAEQISDYGLYGYDYVNTYDGNGNKKYSIVTGTGSAAGRDSFVYVYDLGKTTKFMYGYPNAKLYGTPDKNLLTQIRRYDTAADTLKSTTNYTYVLDDCGVAAKRTNTTNYAGSGLSYQYIENIRLKCK